MREHLQALLSIGFSGDIKKLASLEEYAHKHAVHACNFDVSEQEEQRIKKQIMQVITKLFYGIPNGFFINRDPRGYALKIEGDKVPEGLYKDWGGHGILCPTGLHRKRP